MITIILSIYIRFAVFYPFLVIHHQSESSMASFSKQKCTITGNLFLKKNNTCIKVSAFEANYNSKSTYSISILILFSLLFFILFYKFFFFNGHSFEIVTLFQQ